MAEQRTINFMGGRRIAAALSLLLVLVAIGSLAFKQLNLGLDFTGGTLVEVHYSEPVALDKVRRVMSDAGHDNAVIVYYGSEQDVLLRLQQGYSDTLGETILQTLQQRADTQVSLRRVEFVGPQVGEQLREEGGLAMLMALLLVMIYVGLRFQYKFAVGAVAALIHDVIIILGLFSLFEWEFDLTVLAALLAVIGYSLNDTIVVADRIRENFRLIRKAEPVAIVNNSLTQMLGRTLVTSLTTLMVLIALFYFGGEMIHNFSLALIVGVIVGTYSSIYVSANVLLLLNVDKEDLMVPAKEGENPEDVDGLP